MPKGLFYCVGLLRRLRRILLVLKLAFVIEGWLIPENKGPMFLYYNAVSAGKVIPKYKIRLIKTRYIEPEGAKWHDWIAYAAEWTPDSRTYMGRFVKKFYLDELPQFYSVLKGDVFDLPRIGPRRLRAPSLDVRSGNQKSISTQPAHGRILVGCGGFCERARIGLGADAGREHSTEAGV